ncbi:MAG: class I SAM-dependent methyltransferase [Planctomycetes bacterium]|nr:class I SAM-dependent methyltransferase [Planctomycetota bacterium]
MPHALRTAIRRLLRRFGIDLHRTVPGGSYVHCPPYSYATYAPWFEPEFQSLYAEIRGHTVVSEDRAYALRQRARHCAHLPGDFAECGVYKGGTAWLIAHTLRDSGVDGKRLFLFDTFRGMPEDADRARDYHAAGDLGDVDLAEVQRYLSIFGGVEFRPGPIPETFGGLDSSRFAFVHVDVDIYPASRDCCRWFYDRLVAGGVLVFDDYGFAAYRRAQRQAVDEFFADKRESPMVMRTGQCLVVKLAD